MAAAPKEKSFYAPTNGIALVEIDTKSGVVKPVKIHEINFTERIYSHRHDFEGVAKAVDKIFVPGEYQQKLIKLSQELCFSEVNQVEPTEPLTKDYFLTIRFVPIGKRKSVGFELFFNRRIEKKGKVREIYDQIMSLEKATTEFR